jgi:UDP-N-acetylmuramyl pentapeptide phosphotransferase/UDP-N-acetylglucosamine-1-phosphate transferase
VPHAGGSVSAWIPAIVAGAAVSAIATWLAIGYARRRRLIDHPGARRSHLEPTPRGGGIGIVLATLACAVAPAWVHPVSSRIAAPSLMAAILLVAAVGWIDDHRGLSARWRLATHGVAAIVFLLPVVVPMILLPDVVTQRFSVSAAPVWSGIGAAVLGIAWFVNLHNFMDGIDGILAAQALFVFVALALLLARAGEPHAGQVAVFAAATAGFVPFNFPRARIFMGDVGSGVVGLLVAVAVIWQMSAPGIALASGLILCSAFVTDATCTLLSRMVRGRRWYHAHREHLYQWLARSGFSHVGVVALYMAWNLVIVVPVVAWINRSALPGEFAQDPSGIAAAAGVYALATAVWLAAKRTCLRNKQRRRQHAAA